MFFRKLLLLMSLVLLAIGPALADTGVYVDDLNIYASRQFDNFKKEISMHYGLSSSRFDIMLRKVDSPGDLAVSLWLSHKSQQPIDNVVGQYRLRRTQGWGAIANELGIKPGSDAFKKLKEGDLGWYPKDFAEVMKDVKMTDEQKKAAIREEKIRKAKEKKAQKRKNY